ncbi:MAG: tRNA (adenosine(37)-N6)-dimethylallyltransferase MiaA [Pseudomonadota bacterium]
MRRPILIAGPTASGKSGLALKLAKAHDGVIINADSQQIFRDWQVLTARPSETEMAQALHRLYGHVALDATYSTGHWLREVVVELERSREAGKRPIITGGTGLYFKALTEGLAPIPPTPPQIRAAGEALLSEISLTGLVTQLKDRDPETAAQIDLANPMRVLRAWEVLETTGTGLTAWQARTDPPVLPLADCTALVVVPDREALYANCEARFDQMLENGALEEAKRIKAMALPDASPGLKALGAPELFAHLDGEISLKEAATRAKAATRRYAKRQLTWARNQMSNWPRIDPSATLDLNIV